MVTILRRRQNESTNKRKKKISHWELITSSGEGVCFVCDKPLKSKKHKPVYIGKHNENGDKLFRHVHCEPLSLNWMKKFGTLL